MLHLLRENYDTILVRAYYILQLREGLLKFMGFTYVRVLSGVPITEDYDWA